MMQKRLNLRRSTIIPTEVMSPYWREPMDLVAADLSPNGMYLISDAFPTVGEFVFCSFALRGENAEYRMLSRIKRLNFHRRRTDRIRPGFGVEFLGVDDNSKSKILSALRGLPPPIPSRGRDTVAAEPVVCASRLFISIPRPTIPLPSPSPSLSLPLPSSQTLTPASVLPLPHPGLAAAPMPASALHHPTLPVPTPTLPLPMPTFEPHRATVPIPRPTFDYPIY